MRYKYIHRTYMLVGHWLTTFLLWDCILNYLLSWPVNVMPTDSWSLSLVESATGILLSLVLNVGCPLWSKLFSILTLLWSPATARNSRLRADSSACTTYMSTCGINWWHICNIHHTERQTGGSTQILIIIDTEQYVYVRLMLECNSVMVTTLKVWHNAIRRVQRQVIKWLKDRIYLIASELHRLVSQVLN